MGTSSSLYKCDATNGDFIARPKLDKVDETMHMRYYKFLRNKKENFYLDGKCLS